jgi:hypothetical protein
MIKIDKTYKHYKNKDSYIVKGFCKIQENDIWVKAVIYKPIDCEELFVRPLKEFEEKFSLV